MNSGLDNLIRGGAEFCKWVQMLHWCPLLQLFRRGYRPQDWLISHAGKGLVRLSFVGYSDGFCFADFLLGLVGIGLHEWERALEEDPRDVPWVFIGCTDGREFPFCSFTIVWAPAESRVSLRWTDCFRTARDTWWTRLKAGIGFAEKPVAQDRAPFGWKRLSERSIEKKLRHDDLEEVCEALTEIGYYCSKSQIKWASDILAAYASHENQTIRRLAIKGIGELARVHAYADIDRIAPLILNALNDGNQGVSWAARRTFDEIRRFAAAAVPTVQ